MEAVGFLRAIVAGAIVLGVLVLVHEWGHFIAAKLCGVRVDVFSIGFGKRLWGVKRGDTDYRVSALPLGGYVRMAGDNPVEERTGAAYEFLSRPRWQRFLIAIAGPATNIALTFLILLGLSVFVGTTSGHDRRGAGWNARGEGRHQAWRFDRIAGRQARRDVGRTGRPSPEFGRPHDSFCR